MKPRRVLTRAQKALRLRNAIKRFMQKHTLRDGQYDRLDGAMCTLEAMCGITRHKDKSEW